MHAYQSFFSLSKIKYWTMAEVLAALIQDTSHPWAQGSPLTVQWTGGNCPMETPAVMASTGVAKHHTKEIE